MIETVAVRLWRDNGPGSVPRWTLIDEVACYRGQPERSFRAQVRPPCVTQDIVASVNSGGTPMAQPTLDFTVLAREVRTDLTGGVWPELDGHLTALLTLLWCQGPAVQSRVLERLCRAYGRTCVLAAEQTIDSAPVAEQLGKLLESVGDSCRVIAERLPQGISPDEAREILPHLQHVKQRVTALDASVIAALTGGE